MSPARANGTMPVGHLVQDLEFWIHKAMVQSPLARPPRVSCLNTSSSGQ